MKITFVVPTLNLSGGLRVIAIYADKLKQRGHEVTVVSPNKRIPPLKKRIRFFLQGRNPTKDKFRTDFFNNLDVNLKILDQFGPVKNTDVPDADIVVATFWNTAEWVKEFSPNKGVKVYFIQHHETHHWLPIERVIETYKLPFHKIVVSQWLVDIMKDQYGINDVALVENGVDPLLFNAPVRGKSKTPTVGVMYAEKSSFKGCDTSIKSVMLARESIPELKLIAFSAKKPTAELPLPSNTEFHLRPKQSLIKDIYSSCDAWLFGSRLEGFGLPILEAMACRTPVIGTTAGAAPQLIKEGSGYLVDIEDADAMAKAIVDVCKMPDSEWQSLSESAFQISKMHHWDDKVEKFEQELLKIS